MSKFKVGDKVLVEGVIFECPNENNLMPVRVADSIGIFAAERYIHPFGVCKEKEVHVGDVVMHLIGKKCVITKTVSCQDNRCCVLWEDGAVGTVNKNEIIKTGRTIDIDGVLVKIAGIGDAES